MFSCSVQFLSLFSVTAVWQQILEPFEKMRVDNDLVRCFPSQLTGEDLFGLTEPAVIRIVESVSISIVPLSNKFGYVGTAMPISSVL